MLTSRRSELATTCDRIGNGFARRAIRQFANRAITSRGTAGARCAATMPAQVAMLVANSARHPRPETGRP